MKISLLSLKLLSLGVKHIGIWMDNSPPWVVIHQLAAMKAEIAITPIPPFFSPQQVHHLFAQGAVELLFVSNPSLARPFIADRVAIDEPELLLGQPAEHRTAPSW